MKKVLCVGEALIDMICTDKDATLSQGEHFLKKPGGAPTNVAAAIAALGGDVALAAKVGNDPFGEQLIGTMKEFGVSTQWMLKDDEHFTTMAFVSLMENGERDFVFNRGADAFLTTDDLKDIKLSEFSILHFGSATAFLPGPLQETCLALLERAVKENVLISFDPNYRHLLFPGNTTTFIEQSWHFLNQSHFAKLSEEEAMLITGGDTLHEAVEILPEKTKTVFTITLGEKGALLGFNGKTEIIASVPANVVDTTGAGDAFVGSVLYQLSNTTQTFHSFSAEDWKQIVFDANKIAAKTCEYFGAMEAFRHFTKKEYKPPTQDKNQ